MVLIQLTHSLDKHPRNGFTNNNKLFFRYLRGHGLLPFTFDIDKDDEKFFWLFKIHSLIMIIALCINFYFFATYKDYHVNVGGVSWFADIGIWFGLCWVTLVAYIEISIKSTSQKRLILLINHLDTVLRDDFKCEIPYNALQKYKYVKYGWVQLIIGTTMIVISRNIFLNHFRQHYCQLLTVCHLVHAVSMMFVFYLDAVHDRLSVCSDKIRSLMEEDPIVWFTKRKGLSERLISKVSTRQLYLIKDIINVAEEIFKLLNGCFGWTLVFLFVTYGLETICNAYWIFLVVSGGARTESIWGRYILTKHTQK